jgi:hypothetical protein
LVDEEDVVGRLVSLSHNDVAEKEMNDSYYLQNHNKTCTLLLLPSFLLLLLLLVVVIVIVIVDDVDDVVVINTHTHKLFKNHNSRTSITNSLFLSS